MYLEGRGVPQSDTEALRWLRAAADQGEAEAQLSLARMYKDGRAVPQDYIQAHMWANVAVSRARALTEFSGQMSPDELSQMRRYYTALRDELAAMMTPEQLAQAQALARNWKPTAPSAVPGAQPPKESAPPTAEKEVFAGSGFVVGRLGIVVTNHHVVDGCAQIVAFSSGSEQKLGIIADDGRNDLAAIGPIKQAAGALPFSGQRPKLGQNVIAVGYPLQGILSSSVNVTTGTVSALAGLQDDTRMIQVTAPVQPGNSGGPLLDQSGAVIGIVTSKLDALKTAELVGDVPQNVNFAIREATVRAFLDANGVEYAIQHLSANLDTVAVADRAKKAVVRIECRK
jgi:S1-C subfamily serine protease